MSNTRTYPTVLEGTVFRAKSSMSANQRPMIQFALSVFAGKDDKGAYRKGPWVDVRVVGDAASSFPMPKDRDRVRVEGHLEQRTFKRADGSEGSGLDMTAFVISSVQFQPQAEGTRPRTTEAAAAPAPKPADLDPVGEFDDDCPF